MRLPPRIRRLQSEYRRLRELADGSDLFEIAVATGDPPDSYIVTFACTGVIGLRGSQPILGHDHRVAIELGAEFPFQPPLLRWLTPLFHPNVSVDGRWVCISAWHASQYLDNLCIMLGRMIQYKNFDPYSTLRPEAAQWALACSSVLPIDDRPLRRELAQAPSGVPLIRFG